MMLSMVPVLPPRPVGRLAPSPTGDLHLGHARSFLLAWWSVRSRGGRIVLRMEDLDQERSKPQYADGVRRDLEWLGLDWDGPILWQSERAEAYTQALEKLVTYPCVCTRKEIEQAAAAPHPEDAGSHQPYAGTCRGRFTSPKSAQSETGRLAALRLRVDPGTVEAQDLLHGRLIEDVAATVGDFPVTRRGGAAAYQLAVVVDDAYQGVTEVVRGQDLLSSTLRQALLIDSLDLERPQWIHVPLVTDAAGRRLAKRRDDLSMKTLREAGVRAEALVAWAARTSGLDVPEAVTAAEVLPSFRWEDLAFQPTAVEPSDWI